jgi:diguanylate cyclase (GGDEF)-like protein/PAS domain S-box-containing protein
LSTPIRARRPGWALASLLIGSAILAIDLAATTFYGAGPIELFGRMAVLVVSLPMIAWYFADRVARRSLDRERLLHERQEALLQNASDMILIVDEGVVSYQSPSLESLLGYECDELTGRDLENLISTDDGGSISELLEGLEPGGSVHIECQVRHRDGRLLPVDLSASLGDNPAVGGIVLTMHDISKWKELEEQLTRQAFHDPLTALPNRELFIDRLEHALARRRRHAKGVSVLFLDLDDFKTVNDSLGHAEGDNLIRQVASRLAGTVRPGDTAARLGGDEFALLLEDVDEEQAVGVGERVLAELDSPFDLGDRSLLMGASMGIALSSAELTTATDMLRAADIAMYESKGAGKGSYRVFEPAMHQATTERLRLGADLRGAVERGEFVLHYQPTVDLATRAVAGMEALVRWEHPERGLLAPAEFIPLAEHSGLIVPLGQQVLNEACRQAREWLDARPDRPISISVNLSGIQLQDSGLVAAVSLALEESELPPELLILEMTESVMASDDAHILRRLRQLKGLGVRLAIDDFGTGYSSLSYLRSFPIDVVKIDRSFVDGIANGREEAAVFRAIVRLAHGFRLKTVAEGAETEGQARKLKAAGCDQAQGFYFAKPLSPRDASGYLLGNTTISLWVGYTGPELEVMRSVVCDFETRHPGIRVELTGGVYDDKIIAAMREGVPPTVISSFESDNFGFYASKGALLDLGPYLERDEIDDAIFAEATHPYTRYEGRRWALPMLADAYGLYWNRSLFAKAGLSGPPRTIGELTEYAKKLTRRNVDGSLAVVGFNPIFGFYENSVANVGHLFAGKWTDGAGRSGLASDPAWSKMLRWQRELVDWYGYENLLRFQEEVGGEFTEANAFHTGRLAMCLDGEWRLAFIAASGSGVDYGTAPLPVDEAHPELYGSGFINGTIVGMPANAPHPDEGWQLVRYLTTDDAALAKLAIGLRNIPSTQSSLGWRDPARDDRFAVFVEIFGHPRSSSPQITAVGVEYQNRFAEFAERWQAGEVRDLRRGLREVDQTINAQIWEAAGLSAAARTPDNEASPRSTTRRKLTPVPTV